MTWMPLWMMVLAVAAEVEVAVGGRVAASGREVGGVAGAAGVGSGIGVQVVAVGEPGALRGGPSFGGQSQPGEGGVAGVGAPESSR